MKNGMVPVSLPREQVVELLQDATEMKEVEVDLATQVGPSPQISPDLPRSPHELLSPAAFG